MWTQILLPVILGALLFVVIPLILWLTRLGDNSDVGRWAAISTMWLLIPVVILLVVLFAVLVVLIILASQVSRLLPTYGLRAQRFTERVAWGTGRAAEMIRMPVVGLRAVGKAARVGFARLRERV